jgi:hypothetical protein
MGRSAFRRSLNGTKIGASHPKMRMEHGVFTTTSRAICCDYRGSFVRQRDFARLEIPPRDFARTRCKNSVRCSWRSVLFLKRDRDNCGTREPDIINSASILQINSACVYWMHAIMCQPQDMCVCACACIRVYARLIMR